MDSGSEETISSPLTDSVSFSSVLVATMWLGFTPFGISPRNSPAAVAHLLRATHVIQLIVSPDPAMQRLAAAAVALLEQDGVLVEILPMVQYTEISDAHAENQKAGGGAEVYEGGDLKPAKFDLDKTAIMLHSSGKSLLRVLSPLSSSGRRVDLLFKAARRSRSRSGSRTGHCFSTPCFRVRSTVFCDPAWNTLNQSSSISLWRSRPVRHSPGYTTRPDVPYVYPCPLQWNTLLTSCRWNGPP